MDKIEINKINVEFIEKYKNIDKYLLVREGFVFFNFIKKNNFIKLKFYEDYDFLILDGKKVNKNNYHPVKLSCAGNMIFYEQKMLFTEYEDKLVFVLK